MKEPGFTKGEWEQLGILIVAFGNEGAVICQMAEPHPKSGDAEYQSLELGSKGWDLQMANASLIIAAPAMYEALKAAQEGTGDWRAVVDLALAQAEGR